jgi:phage tail sheath protein FI
MFGAPGVYFQTVDRRRPSVAALRTDVAGFVGYAERGPIDRPVKLTSWRQFLVAFGPPLAGTYGGHAVRAFFENGGAACHMRRIADPETAALATLTIVGADGGPALDLFAAFSAIAIARPEGSGPVVAAPQQATSPGAWGTRLAGSILDGGLGATETLGAQPEDGASVRVQGFTGFRAGTIVRFVQDGTVAAGYGRVRQIDPGLSEIIWATPITGLGLDLARPFRLETVEFTLLVHFDGQVVERHADLSLDPDHPRSAAGILASDSTYLGASGRVDAADLVDPGRWPAPADRLPLTGGRDGLATVTRDHYLSALDDLARVDEVSLLAAPDLVLRPRPASLVERAAVVADPCKSLAPPPRGRLQGIVLTADDAAQPIAGARVRAVGAPTSPTITAADGRFELSNLPLGRVTLVVTREGFVESETTAQVYAVPPAEPTRLFLAPIATPPGLSHDDIFDVQAAMARQGELGLYRVAVLDPPEELVGFEEVQTWRARFDTPFAALYYPWIVSRDEQTGDALALPPSGAVTGVIARTDLATGPHRAPANERIVGADTLSVLVSAEEQAVLNPLGINCLRATPGRGVLVYGARTISSDPAWRYLNVRRLVLMIAEAIQKAHQWAVFEPNTRTLREALTHSLSSFLNLMWRRGALAGGSPEGAYAVKCDEENNPPAVVDAGRVIAEIAIAPSRPFEFVILRLGRTQTAVEVRE